MSNLPARRRSSSILSPPVPDVMPPDWLDRLNTDWSMGPHTAGTKELAKMVLEQLEPFAEPVTEALVRAWFAPVVLTVSNPRPAEQIGPYIAALMLALDGVASGAFTAVTQRDLLRRCTHWPAAAEVYEVVSAITWKLHADIAGLKRILAAPLKTESPL